VLFFLSSMIYFISNSIVQFLHQKLFKCLKLIQILQKNKFVNGMLVSYVIGKLKEKYVLIFYVFFLNLVQMDNFQKIDLFRFMNNFIQVVKPKTFANMHSLHLIVITTEQVILILLFFFFYI
jgi:hypothetical protein